MLYLQFFLSLFAIFFTFQLFRPPLYKALVQLTSSQLYNVIFRTCPFVEEQIPPYLSTDQLAASDLILSRINLTSLWRHGDVICCCPMWRYFSRHRRLFSVTAFLFFVWMTCASTLKSKIILIVIWRMSSFKPLNNLKTQPHNPKSKYEGIQCILSPKLG